MDASEPITDRRMTGREVLHRDGIPLEDAPRLIDFWSWSSSQLVGNALRGILAEFIVASALGCAEGVRREWDAYDILTHDGLKIEVKSSAYIQSWSQPRLSTISFDISPKRAWDGKSNTTASIPVRSADVYIFCLLNHKDRMSIDPLNLSQWRFHVLSRQVLDSKGPGQKTITLSSLTKLNPQAVQYEEIAGAVRDEANRI
ncbi:hypothetical protein KQI84_13620 [bacterium]|nr:hypothetical protein [bacterium]